MVGYLASGAVGSLLYIPWFRAEAWEIPLPFSMPIFGETLPIQPFGLLVAIGVLLGAKVAEIFAKRNGINPHVEADFVTHVVVCGFIGGYLLNGIFYHPDTVSEILGNPSLIFQRWLGLSSYGGFIGAILGLLLWRWRRQLPVSQFADITVFALPFGWLFGRTGCFVVHDHPGRVTEFPLAVANYHFGPEPFQPRHDLGFYEVLWSAACITVLLVLARKKRPVGFYAALVPLLYTPIRFMLDFLRAEPELGGDARYLGLTPAQYASVLIGVLGGVLMWRVYHRPAPDLPAEAKWPPPDEEQAEGDEASSRRSSSSTKKKGSSQQGKKAKAGKGKGR